MPAYRAIVAELIEGETVLRLLLSQPTGNVLSIEMMRELHDALDRHRDRRHLKLVMIRGAGGQFSFGASIPEHDRTHVRELLGTFHALVRNIAAFPVSVAALVEGRCLGGAFELALCCHLLFATSDAHFGCPEIKLGVFAPVLAAAGACRLPGAMAERLLLTGDEITTADAERVGLVTAVLPGADPESALLDWYRGGLARRSAFALRQATAAFRQRSPLLRALEERLPQIERQYLDEVVSSHDGNEGIAAFLERRAPEWRDA